MDSFIDLLAVLTGYALFLIDPVKDDIKQVIFLNGVTLRNSKLKSLASKFKRILTLEYTTSEHTIVLLFNSKREK